jgi:hypothetical protein
MNKSLNHGKATQFSSHKMIKKVLTIWATKAKAKMARITKLIRTVWKSMGHLTTLLQEIQPLIMTSSTIRLKIIKFKRLDKWSIQLSFQILPMEAAKANSVSLWLAAKLIKVALEITPSGLTKALVIWVLRTQRPSSVTRTNKSVLSLAIWAWLAIQSSSIKVRSLWIQITKRSTACRGACQTTPELVSTISCLNNKRWFTPRHPERSRSRRSDRRCLKRQRQLVLALNLCRTTTNPHLYKAKATCSRQVTLLAVKGRNSRLSLTPAGKVWEFQQDQSSRDSSCLWLQMKWQKKRRND